MINHPNPVLATLAAARALLRRIDNITTDEFANGGERAERETLRAAFEALDATEQAA